MHGARMGLTGCSARSAAARAAATGEASLFGDGELHVRAPLLGRERVPALAHEPADVAERQRRVFARNDRPYRRHEKVVRGSCTSAAAALAPAALAVAAACRGRGGHLLAVRAHGLGVPALVDRGLGLVYLRGMGVVRDLIIGQ